jgi:hypothetical protein
MVTNHSNDLIWLKLHHSGAHNLLAQAQGDARMVTL